MAFAIRPLSKPPGFFADARTGFFLVEGAGQSVFWRNCYVLVFRSGETKTPLEKHAACDGEGLLPRGLDAFFGGPNGRFKEVKAREEEEVKAEPAETTKGEAEAGGRDEQPAASGPERRRVACSACKGTGFVEEP